MRKQTIKPSKSVSKFTFFMGLLFCLIGFVIIIGGLLTPMPFMTVSFGIIWTIGAIYNTYRAYKNGFTEEGEAIYEINYTEGNSKHGYDFEEKLRRIERLRKEGLITEDEYNQKRSEIMKEKW